MPEVQQLNLNWLLKKKMVQILPAINLPSRRQTTPQSKTQAPMAHTWVQVHLFVGTVLFQLA